MDIPKAEYLKIKSLTKSAAVNIKLRHLAEYPRKKKKSLPTN